MPKAECQKGPNAKMSECQILNAKSRMPKAECQKSKCLELFDDSMKMCVKVGVNFITWWIFDHGCSRRIHPRPQSWQCPRYLPRKTIHQDFQEPRQLSLRRQEVPRQHENR